MDYDSPTFMYQIEKYSDDPDGAWLEFKRSFAKKPPADRIADLRTADAWLAEQTTVTREHASTLAAKRELDALHFMLRAGDR
jgi:hypothetical protein